MYFSGGRPSAMPEKVSVQARVTPVCERLGCGPCKKRGNKNYAQKATHTILCSIPLPCSLEKHAFCNAQRCHGATNKLSEYTQVSLFNALLEPKSLRCKYSPSEQLGDEHVFLWTCYCSIEKSCLLWLKCRRIVCPKCWRWLMSCTRNS